MQACLAFGMSTKPCCLPAFPVGIVLPLAIGRTRASSAENRITVALPGDANEHIGLARLDLSDGKPDGQIDPRERFPGG